MYHTGSHEVQPFGGEDVTCGHQPDPTRVFCPRCGKVQDRKVLESIRLAGIVDVRISTNPEIERFWKTGDPSRL